MKKILFISLIVLLVTSCYNTKKYGICFNLRQSEKEVISILDELKSEYRYEKSRSDQYGVIRVKHFEYENMEFNTIRLCFKNSILSYMEFRVHEIENITNVINYLEDTYGKGKENDRFLSDSNLCSKYWGDIDSDFMCIEKCSDDYYKIHICNGDAQETKVFFKNMVIGENYNKVMMN